MTKVKIIHYRRAVPVLIPLLVLFWTGCAKQVDWIYFRGRDGAGYTSESIHPPLGVRWNLKLQESETAKSFNPPVVRGDSIYFGSDDGNFYSQNVTTGYMNWIFKTRAPVNSIPFVGDDTVYFGSNDGSVYAVNRKDGEKLWEFATGNTVQSLVLRYRESVIFTSDTGATFFLDSNGRETNRIDNPVWSHHTFQVFDDVVYWAPLGRSFGAYSLPERRFLWTVDVDVPYSVWYSFPAIDNERVYYASSYLSQEGVTLRYYAANRITGETVWQRDEGMDIGDVTPYNADTLFFRHVRLLDYMAPALWRNTVIYTSGDAIVRAFNAKSGEPVWDQTFGYPTSSAPTVAGDRVYFGLRGAEDGSGDPPTLVCISARDGRLLWSMETDGAVLSAPVISGKRIFFGTENSRFYVLEEIF
jgi:outer membrane protein assembly factor BamB